MPDPPQLTVIGPPSDRVWRVGFRPDPWVWPDWKWAQDGRFHGRWDDRTGTFRTLYVASSLVGCLLEVLAPLRPDPAVVQGLADIVEDVGDAEDYPTVEAGEVDPSWMEVRAAGSAVLAGDYCAVTATETVAALRPQFIAEAVSLGRLDFDAAALKDGGTRSLTQGVSTYVYETTDLAGIRFASRHGDEQLMWAIFERAGEPAVSPRLDDLEDYSLDANTPDLLEAFRIHRLRWRGEPPPAETPLPMVRVDEPEDQFLTRFFGDEGPNPTTVLGAAVLWNTAISDPTTYAQALENLTVDTSLWDFSEVHSVLRDLGHVSQLLAAPAPPRSRAGSVAGRSRDARSAFAPAPRHRAPERRRHPPRVERHALAMTSRPILDPDEPERVAHVKYINYAGDGVAKMTGPAALLDVWLLTLRRDDGPASIWRVWGFQHNDHPAAAEVLA